MGGSRKRERNNLIIEINNELMNKQTVEEIVGRTKVKDEIRTVKDEKNERVTLQRVLVIMTKT